MPINKIFININQKNNKTMKKSELRQLIREEIFKLRENAEEIPFNSIKDMSNFLVKGDYDELDGYENKEFEIIKKHIESDILDKGEKLTPSSLNSLIVKLENKYGWY
jgi:hypothetical protein